jgi:hypothetical protein
MNDAMTAGVAAGMTRRAIGVTGGGTVIADQHNDRTSSYWFWKETAMKTIALGVLLAVTLVSLAGCHWRHRRWRDYHDRSYNSQPSNQLARGQHAIEAPRGI